MRAPFRIFAKADRTLVPDGHPEAAVLVVAAGHEITKPMLAKHDFGAILNPIPEGRSQEEGASPADEAAPASAPPEGEEEPAPESQPDSPPTRRGRRANA